MASLVHLKIVDSEADDVIVVRLTGELDISGAEPTRQRITDAEPSSARGLVIDMSQLDFIDSSGVSMLFALARRVASRRQELRVVAPEGKPVARVLDIVEFDRAAPVHADLDSALAEIA